MEDVNISKYRAQVVRAGSTPASPGFVVSEGQDPVNPSGSSNYVPYSGAISNVDFGEFGLDTGFVTLDTTPTNIPTEQGGIYWDDSRSTAALIMNGTLQHIGQDTFFYVKNSTGSSIPKGTAVRFDGTDGASGHLLIAPFLANGTYPSNYFMGVTAEVIANGSFGQVMHFGELTGVNTSGYTAGALLYVSTSVAGAFQTTAPVAPNNIVLVAAAINSTNNGTILVRPTYGSNINQDEGVKITSGTTGDLLQLQAGGLWENKTLAQVLGGTSSQFVKGDGSLDSTSYQPLLTNPITGTGTTNYLPKFTGASSLGNSNIQDSGSLVSVAVASNFSSTVTAANNFLVDNASASKKGYTYRSPASNWGAQISGLYFTPNNAIDARTTFTVELWNGVGSIITPLTITDEGKVGIGTTTPDSGLQINSGATRGLRVDVNSGVQAISISPNGIFGVDEPGLGNGRFIVNTNGKVGIGTNVPSEKLHIAGVGSAIALDTTGAVANNLISTVEDFKLSLRCLRGSSSEIKIGNNNLEFLTNSNPRITVFSDGNTFIGASPTNAGFKLDVNGTGRFSGALTGTSATWSNINVFTGALVGAGSQRWIGSDGGAGLFLNTPSGSNLNLAINNNPVLGIASTGAATFSSSLTANSSIISTTAFGGTFTTSDGTNQVRFGSYFNSIGAGNSYDGVIYTTSASGALYFLTGGSTTAKMLIASGGNVLIGTTTDSGQKLRVNGTALISSNYNNFQTSSKTAASTGTITFSYNTDYNTGSDGDNTGGIIIINVNEASTNANNGNAVYIGTVINPRGSAATVTQISRTLGSGITALTVSSSGNNITVTATVGSGGNFRATLTFIGGAGTS